MTTKRKTTTKRAPAWTKTVRPEAFASLGAVGRGPECMIRVGWSGYDPNAAWSKDENSHLIRRGEVIADLGMPPPDPPFTDDEMQRIAFAAKGAAIKCVIARRRAKGR